MQQLAAGGAAAAEAMAPLFNCEAVPLHPARVAKSIITFLNSAAGQEMAYFADGGDSVTWGLISAAVLGLSHPFVGRGFLHSSIGCVGASWGVISGYYQAYKRPILHSIGDGSFGQYIGELYTFAKEKIPYVCIIFNDGNWGMIKAFSMCQVPEEDHDLGALICMPDCADGYFHYETIAQGWGGKGYCVKDPSQLDATIAEAVESAKDGVPAIVNVLVDCKKEYFSMATVGLYQELSSPKNIRYK